MITADTLTDEMIRKLRDRSGCWTTRSVTSIALDLTKGHLYRADARSRCAAILNAQVKESGR